ncbi:hypothetical protein FB45DRAFT_896682 [Roridomyces roridus]|uniref:Uncharacterized protein n=1 Tax=Roridomyces roridus TaxID=1738132 RepID=A0AAD7CAU4_9AGAR|nr:hypothetical protein FB45DRAFT_896682 [Roridomyces roridus]
MAPFAFVWPATNIAGHYLLPEKRRVPGTTNRFIWVMPQSHNLHIARTALGETLIREEYQKLLLAILSSLHRLQGLGPMGALPQFDPIPDPMDFDAEYRPAEPLQLRVDKGYQSVASFDIYPNPFLKERNHRLYRRGGGVIITGFPGIGKTRMLGVIFHLRAAANLATLYMSDPSSALLYQDYQFATIRECDLSTTTLGQNLPREAWCLVDSNVDFELVHPAIRSAGYFFIQATSPRKRRFAYIKYMVQHPQFCVMAQWTLSELFDGMTLGPSCLTTEGIRNFYLRYGGSARHAFQESSNPQQFEARIQRAARQLDVREIQGLIGLPIEDFTVPEDIGDMLVSVFPIIDEDRSLFCISAPSRAMHEILCPSDCKETSRSFFDTCVRTNTPDRHSLAGELVDQHFHALLLKGGGICPLNRLEKGPPRAGARNIGWKGNTAVSGECLRTVDGLQTGPISTVHFVEELESGMSMQVGFYHSPVYRACPAFDSFFCGKPDHAIVFQASVAARRTLNTQGCFSVGRHRLIHPSFLQGLEWLKAKGISRITYICITAQGMVPTVGIPVEWEHMFDGLYFLPLQM